MANVFRAYLQGLVKETTCPTFSKELIVFIGAAAGELPWQVVPAIKGEKSQGKSWKSFRSLALHAHPITNGTIPVHFEIFPGNQKAHRWSQTRPPLIYAQTGFFFWFSGRATLLGGGLEQFLHNPGCVQLDLGHRMVQNIESVSDFNVNHSSNISQLALSNVFNCNSQDPQGRHGGHQVGEGCTTSTVGPFESLTPKLTQCPP